MTIAWPVEHLGRTSLGRVESGLFRRSGLRILWRACGEI